MKIWIAWIGFLVQGAAFWIAQKIVGVLFLLITAFLSMFFLVVAGVFTLIRHGDSAQRAGEQACHLASMSQYCFSEVVGGK